MKLKSEKGFTGVDVTVAILIISIFTTIIASLYINYNNSSKGIERKAEATQYAVQTIEEIKANSAKYFNEENANLSTITVYSNEQIGNSAYTRNAVLTDYTATPGNSEKQEGVVKIAKVEVKYKSNNKEEKVELSTVISKEK